MKLGTLRFSPKHRAARAARARRAKRFAEAQAVSAMLNSISPEQLDVARKAHDHILDVMRGAYVWNTQGPPRHPSWWERLTGGRTTIFYGGR